MATKTKVDLSKLVKDDGNKTPLGILTNRISMLQGKFKTLSDSAKVSAYRNVTSANPEELFPMVDALMETFKESYQKSWDIPISTSSSAGLTPEQKSKALYKQAQDLGIDLS